MLLLWMELQDLLVWSDQLVVQVQANFQLARPQLEQPQVRHCGPPQGVQDLSFSFSTGRQLQPGFHTTAGLTPLVVGAFMSPRVWHGTLGDRGAGKPVSAIPWLVYDRPKANGDSP